MSLPKVTRRAAAATVGAALACGLPGTAAAAAPERRVALLGDSITAGYGLPASEALPVRLQQQLRRLGEPARVIGEGVVGETTGGGLARVARGAGAGVDVCVVALGGNDLLQGIDPQRIRDNLDRIVRRLKAEGVTVVLAGIQVPPLLQGAYATAFDTAFAKVAHGQSILFVPDMLGGVALNPALNQRDGLHPNALGVELIARRLAPVVAKALQAR